MLGPLQDHGGPTETHAPQTGSRAIDAGDPNASAGVGRVPEHDQRGMPFGRVEGGTSGMTRIDIGAFEVQTPTSVDCDFDGMNGCDLEDIDALILEIVAGTNNLLYDLTEDTRVNLADRDQWLQDAGAMNLMSGSAYLLGDSNLDGIVDGQDFILWNGNKFTSTGKWSQADWNADGVTDGQDFILWNANKFQSSDSAVMFPSQLTSTGPLAVRQIDSVFANLDQRESTRDRPEVDLFNETLVVNPWFV